jgi:hypothetical protein
VLRFAIGIDIEKYSPRNARQQLKTQDALDVLLNEAAQAAGLDRDAWERNLGGDGEIDILPADTDLEKVLGAFVSQLDSRLRTYNDDHSEIMQIRLRVAVHASMTMPGPLGHAWHAPVEVSRLLNSGELTQALKDASGVNLAMLVSKLVHGLVAQAGYPSVQAAQFQPLRVNDPDKGFLADAYLYVPRGIAG